MFAVALAAKTEHAMTARQARVGGTGLCIGSLPAHSPTRTGAPRLRLPASPVTDGLDLRPTVRRLGCRVKVAAPREETGLGGHRDEGRGWFERATSRVGTLPGCCGLLPVAAVCVSARGIRAERLPPAAYCCHSSFPSRFQN